MEIKWRNNEKRKKIARGETYNQHKGQEKELARDEFEFFTDFLSHNVRFVLSPSRVVVSLLVDMQQPRT